MSLAIDEGEGEQNEMRILSDKLENTAKLVATLSQQLSELREQVGDHEHGISKAPDVFDAMPSTKKRLGQTSTLSHYVKYNNLGHN